MPIRPIRHLVTGLVHPAGLGPIARRNYRWELRSAFLFPIAVACADSSVLGVIANNAFDAPALVVAAVTSAIAAANVTGFLWSSALHGRDRVRFLNTLQLGVLACIAGLAVAPFNTLGLILLTLATFLVRILFAGLVTARADLWRANYPDERRAQVTGRLAMCVALIVSATSLGIGAAMDTAWLGGPNAYRWVFAIAIATGLAGVWMFSKVRWRGRGQQIASELKSRLDRTAAGPRAMVGVLRTDRNYRAYMTAQFILGVSNLAAIPVFIVALKDVFGKSYSESMLLATAIPMVIPVLTIPVWARLLDGMHVIRFRAYHSWFFVASIGLLALGFTLVYEPAIYAAQFIRGIAMGGGMLAWNLGHHDFATRELANVYMGIHTTLTGIRGVLAPLAGAFLYAGFLGSLEPGKQQLMGPYAFYVFAALAVVAALMFIRLHIVNRRAHARADAAESTTPADTD